MSMLFLGADGRSIETKIVDKRKEVSQKTREEIIEALLRLYENCLRRDEVEYQIQRHKSIIT